MYVLHLQRHKNKYVHTNIHAIKDNSCCASQKNDENSKNIDLQEEEKLNPKPVGGGPVFGSLILES